MFNSVSFTARYRQTVNLKQRDENNKFQDCKAKFVELDPENENDRKAISKANRMWGYTYLDDINDELRDCSEYENPTACKRFYAVTTQKSKFNNLKPEKILGAAEVMLKQDNQVAIKYLQVDPNCILYGTDKQYKKVHSSVVDGIKEEYKGKDIITFSLDDDGKKFYGANGFQPYNDDQMIFKNSD